MCKLLKIGITTLSKAKTDTNTNSKWEIGDRLTCGDAYKATVVAKNSDDDYHIRSDSGCIESHGSQKSLENDGYRNL